MIKSKRREKTKAVPGLIELSAPNFITGRQLRRAVREAYRFDFSRSLTNEAVNTIPRNVRCPVSQAFKHTSMDGLTNFRLLFVFEWEGEIVPGIQDVGAELFAVVRRNRFAG